MKIQTALLALATTFSLSCHSDASTNTINFDDYPYGGLSFASSNRYQSAGAIFSRDIPIYSLAAVEPQSWVDTVQAGGGSLPNVMPLSATVDPRITIDMSFVVPGTTNPATTDLVGALFADSEVGSSLGILEAFDVQGNLIASTNPITPPSSTAIIQFSAPGIARVRFSDTGDGVEIDNIFFNTPTPALESDLSIRVSQVELCWDTVTNEVYQLEYRSALTPNIWLPFGGTVVGDGSRFCTNDAVLPGQPQRFYRLVITNSP